MDGSGRRRKRKQCDDDLEEVDDDETIDEEQGTNAHAEMDDNDSDHMSTEKIAV